MSGDGQPVLWRTKLRSTLPGIDHAKQVAHCLQRGVVGIGWGLDDLPTGTTLDLVCETIEKRDELGWGRTAARTVRRFGEEARVGDFVWTRDTAGRYLVSRLAGPYRYEMSAEATAVDVHQVRDVEWAPPLNDLDVPGAVIRAFIGTGLSFSRIHDQRARELTPYLWEKLHGRSLPDLAISPGHVLSSHLDPYDVEDLIYIWLQAERGYLALPRARQRDTPAYEWTMIDRAGKRRGIVQVKTGEDRVDLGALAAAVADDATDTYAFATCGRYDGDPDCITEVIAAEDLLSFAIRHRAILPPRVRTWFDLAS
jgi:hypothetical protein